MRGLLCGVLLAAAVFPWPAIAGPPLLRLGQDTTLVPQLNLAWDSVWFSADPHLRDDSGVRRNEVGLVLDRPGVFGITVMHDIEANAWADVFLRLDTRALGQGDAGHLRLGQLKVPVGLEGPGSSRANSFMEPALATQLVFPGRRVGLEWGREWQSTLLRAAYFSGNDLDDRNPGTLAALRAVWVPLVEDGNVLHLGLSAAQQSPHADAAVRLRARPEAGLTDVYLLDTGLLEQVHRIRRTGLEGVWIAGPFSLQGEVLQARLARDGGLPDYRTHGHYLFASWVFGGAARSYNSGNVGNVKPGDGTASAFELLLRYSRADVEEVAGRQWGAHTWTLGSNWYLGKYLKFQLNLVRARSDEPALLKDSRSIQARVQLAF